MKLYTREQMIQVFNYGQTLEGFDWVGDFIDSLTPIELPSDEEIEEQAVMLIEIEKHREIASYYFIMGQKLFRDKIQGGNK